MMHSDSKSPSTDCCFASLMLTGRQQVLSCMPSVHVHVAVWLYNWSYVSTQ